MSLHLLMLLAHTGCQFYGAEHKNGLFENMELVNANLVVHYHMDDSNFTNEYLMSLNTLKDYSANQVEWRCRPGSKSRRATACLAIREEFGDYKWPEPRLAGFGANALNSDFLFVTK